MKKLMFMAVRVLSVISAKTLIVFGDRDFLYPVGIAFELHAAIPRSFLWVVPNGGHGPIFGSHAATESPMTPSLPIEAGP